ncbi:MAG: ATP-binding protein [Myxococcaceae bacterium]
MGLDLFQEKVAMVWQTLRAFAETTTDYRALVRLVAERIAGLLQNTCTVQLLSADGLTLSPVAVHATDLEVKAEIERLLAARPIVVAEHPIYRKLIRTGEAVLIPHLAPEAHRDLASSPHADFGERHRMHSGLMVALRSRGKAVGALSLGRYDPKLPSFDQRDCELAQVLADHAALAISNAELVDTLQHELAERAKAERALSQAEAQLRQAQKLEAIGRLAAGVAHDFNNSLSVVLSYATLLLEDIAPGDSRRESVEGIVKAGNGAAKLTQQMLAFSRQQVLEPQVLDVNQVMTELAPLLKQLCGAGIILKVAPHSVHRRIKIDRGQLEQALMNLAANARDAMAGSGQLTLETSDAEFDAAYVESHPGAKLGSQVIVSVSDTGTGMTQETKDRIFEPFFTTKERGKGTGLGLSSVLGIVQQSGGVVYVYSELTRGSTFKLYFPVSHTGVSAAPLPKVVSSLSGEETVLVVDDDDSMRRVVQQVLARAGYKVVVAASADAALDTFRTLDRPLHLLLTDLVLDGSSGAELAHKIVALSSSTKVVLMSGYSQHALALDDLPSGFSFLPKPIVPDALLGKVRAALGPAVGR